MAELEKQETVTITRAEYEELFDDAAFLHACYQVGLMGWSKHDKAVKVYEDVISERVSWRK
jgi:hypothetical protein